VSPPAPTWAKEVSTRQPRPMARKKSFFQPWLGMKEHLQVRLQVDRAVLPVARYVTILHV